VKSFLFEDEDVPKTLQFVYAKYLISINLDRNLSAHSSSQHNMSNIANMMSGVQCKLIGKNDLMIASQIIHIGEEEEGASQQQQQQGSENPNRYSLQDKYFVCCDEKGILRFVSCQEKKVIAHANSLEGITSPEIISLTKGQILPNGDLYLLQPAGSILYSATILPTNTHTHHIAYPLPDRAIPTSTPVQSNLTLRHGREQVLQQLKQLIKKRRSSVITLSAAPTDLYKIFHKTREQRQKDELFDRNNTTASSPMITSKKVTQQTNALISNDMQQLKEQFQERGERINRIAMKMDDFKQGAMVYRQQMQAQKELLQKRNNRWGLF